MNRPNITTEKAAKRMLVVIHSMTGGDPAIAISKAEVIAECLRLGILQMSEAEFKDYALKAKSAGEAKRN